MLDKQRWQLISWFDEDESDEDSSSSNQDNSAALEAQWTRTQLSRSYAESFESFDNVNTVQVEFSSAQVPNQEMSQHEYTECYERIMSLPRKEIADKCKELVTNKVELFDFYHEDPRTQREGKYYQRDAISLAELKAMSLGYSLDSV